jgi:hypothetical protein
MVLSELIWWFRVRVRDVRAEQGKVFHPHSRPPIGRIPMRQQVKVERRVALWPLFPCEPTFVERVGATVSCNNGHVRNALHVRLTDSVKRLHTCPVLRLQDRWLHGFL